VALEDPDYLNWIRRQPCCVCECTTERREAHHSTFGPTSAYEEMPSALLRGRGKGQRAHDSWSMPLCAKHHRQLHQLCGHFAGWHKEQLRDWQTAQVHEHRKRYLDNDIF
jgi:hypothetical protein